LEISYCLRHFLAALKYRCSKAIHNVREGYPSYRAGNGVRSPHEILSHISFVLRCAQSVFNVDIELHKEPRTWEEEVEQFYIEVENLNNYLLKGLPDRDRIAEKLLQGPLADAMTHVGQLSMIRRISGDPVSGENFFNADIQI